MDSTAQFNLAKKHPCIVRGCLILANPYQQYCIKHLEMVINNEHGR